MILYFLRAAEAVEPTEELSDQWRFLSGEGMKAVTKTGQKMAEICRMPRLIISSPLVRAVQSAQVATSIAGRKTRLTVSPLLLGEADTDKLRQHLLANTAEKRVMVVGHEPQLGKLLRSFLQMYEEFQLKKGSCFALEIESATEGADVVANFLFYLKPGKQPITSLKKATKKAEEPAPLVAKEASKKGAAKNGAGKKEASKKRAPSRSSKAATGTRKLRKALQASV